MYLFIKKQVLKCILRRKLVNFDHIEELFLPIQKVLVESFTVRITMNSPLLEQIQFWRGYNMELKEIMKQDYDYYD